MNVLKKNMRKLLLVLPLLLCFVQGFAQSSKGLCDLNYSLRLEKNEDYANKKLTADFSWDFSTVEFNTGDVKLEIVPIRDCWKEIQAKKMRDPFFVTVDRKKGAATVEHTAMMAKCFKWRLIVKTDSCNSFSEWNYFSFID